MIQEWKTGIETIEKSFEEKEGTLKLQKFFEEIATFYQLQKRGHEQIKMVLVTLVLWFCPRSVPASAQGATGAAGAAGPPPATNVSSNKRLQQTQAQVDEVSAPAQGAAVLRPSLVQLLLT